MNIPPAIPPTWFFKHITFQELCDVAASSNYVVIAYHHLVKSLINTSIEQHVSLCQKPI